MNWQLNYEITKTDLLYCELIKLFKGVNRSVKYIERYSKRKYGVKNNVARYFLHKFLNLEIGKYTYNWEQIRGGFESIGAFCSIAFGVSIAEGQHPIHYVTTHPITYNPEYGMVNSYDKEVLSLNKKVIIGNDVWIGRNSILFPGIKIGNGVVIGAGSVVRKDVPDYAIIAGVPAKIIRFRFTSEQIELFNQIKWWEWEDSKIKSNIGLLSNPEEFLDKFKGEA